MSTKFEQRITLDFTVARIQNIHCSQDDCNSRSILISLSDNGKPYKLPQSDILCIKISKPDRTFVYMDDDDTHVSRNDDGTISLILPEQATCVPGKCDAEIKIISENSTVTTACFHIIVRKSVLEDNEIESVVESNIIEKMIRHLADESNPHKTDHVQVGLGNVPNVTTNDQTPTYTESPALSALSSGETLSAAFGKTAKAIRTFIEHITEHASVFRYGHTKLEDSVTSTSTDTSATPNSVKAAYDKALDVSNDLNLHNLSENAHADLRKVIEALTSRLNTLSDSDDETLDQFSEIVAYIKNNKSLIDSITTAKLNVTDIVDNLTSAAADKPLSARQGKVLRDLIDTLTNAGVSGVKGDSESAYRTGYVTIAKADIGLRNVANERQYSANNPQPSVTGSSGSCTGNAATATALTSNAGSAAQPVYFSGGKPVACTAYASASVNYANSAGTAATAAKLGRDGNASLPMIFHWSGQAGQPTWLWGGVDGTNMYVYNPANFNVNFANSAGGATRAAQDGNGRDIATTYFPKTGGTLKGNIDMENNKHIKMKNTSGVLIELLGINTVNNIHMGDYNGSNTSAVYMHAKGSEYGFLETTFRPNTTTTQNLGDASHIWKTVYAKTGTINTSDRTKKHDIHAISEVYERLFLSLQPKSFMFDDGDRVHIGAISQDVEDAMKELGIEPEQFAGFCKDVRYEYTEFNEEDGTPVEASKVPCTDEDGNLIYDYALRYQEFIFLTIHMTQRLWEKTALLEKENLAIKDRLKALETTA